MAIGGYTFVFDDEDETQEKIFFDPTERRRGRINSLLRFALAGILVWSGLFFSGTVSLAGLTDEVSFLWRVKVVGVAAFDGPALMEGEAHDHGATTDLRPTLADHHRVSASATCATEPAPVLAALADARPIRRVYGHIPTALPNAHLSLPSSCGALNVLMPDWITLEPSGDGFEARIAADDVRGEIETHHKRGGAPDLLPVVRLGDVKNETALKALLDPSAAGPLDDLTAAAQELGASGTCLDFDQFAPEQLSALTPFFGAYRDLSHARGLKSCVVLSADDTTWRDSDITQIFDRVVLKLFHRAWVGSVPGPVAEERWVADTAAQARELIGRDRLVLALGNFAVDWTIGQPLPETLSYGEIAHRAAAADATIRFSAEQGNGFAAYTDADGQRHRAWVLDAASVHNQLRILDGLNLANIAIWSLGQEDPGLWPLLSGDIRDRAATREALATVRVANHVQYSGRGAFLRVASNPSTGYRKVAFSPETGRITDVVYENLPQPYLIERYGQPEWNRLVLTFDDGPDAEYTARILDILKQAEVPGSFFVVGSRVLQAPDLLTRMIDEGHEIGSHTFSHPHMDQVSRTRGELEHSMMRKLIAGYSGHDTRFYREPFSRAGGPIAEARVDSIAAAQADGAIIAGMEIAPKDWNGMTAEEIVNQVVSETENGAGNVLLFHDGGGDRTETVKALPILIRELRQRGYEFTTLASLLGTTREAVMPASDSPMPGLDKMSFEVMAGIWESLVTVFWVVLALGLTRSVVIFVLVLFHRKQRPIRPHHNPKVAFVVPAHNEENAVGNCIKTLLKSEYENFEVIVVDDGSTDDTFEEVQKLSTDRRVRVFAQLNRGKWGALNTAIRNTDAEILVCIDADTQVRPDVLDHMVKHFSNPRIGAVAGKVVVGNRVNLLTRLQALEYVTAQNFERKAHDTLNSMMVVPGALGAWRTEALRAAGMYNSDTVTEDADMTVAVSRAGYRITYEDRAVAYTEAPETVRLLLSQRLRWSFGMFQTAWKHKGAFRQRVPVGLISLPDLVIFGYLYALLAPVADFFLLILAYNYFFGQPTELAASASLSAATPVALAYLALPLFELLVAGYALKTDKQESMWMLLLFPFQRFFYRQLLYYSALRALLRAVKGSFTGWGIKKRMRRDLLAMQDA